jgi:hypothetical protein
MCSAMKASMRLQRPDLLRMLKLYDGSFLEGPTIVYYDLSVALPKLA